MTLEILPLLILAFTVAVMVQGLLPHQLLSKWGGAESGMRGMLSGTIAGGFTPGGPLCEFGNRCRADSSGALYRCEMKAYLSNVMNTMQNIFSVFINQGWGAGRSHNRM